MRLRFVISVSTLAVIASCSSSKTTVEDGDGGDGGEGGSSMGGTSMGGNAGEPSGGTGGTGGDAAGAGGMGMGGSAGMSDPVDAGLDAAVVEVCEDSTVCAACTEGYACQPEGDAGIGGAECLDIVCTACEVGSYCAGSGVALELCPDGTWDHDQDSTTECQTWTECPIGQFVSTPGSEIVDQACTACPSGMYSDAVNTASCTAWIDCQPGTEVDAEGTPTTDRTCLACTGTTQTTTVNAPTCLPQGACAAGFITVTEATTEADAVCDDSTCVAGTFCAGGLADVVACPTGTFDHDLSAATACQNHTPCTLATQVQTAVGDATNDYACDPRTVCNPGQESTNEGSLDITTDRTCADCPIGEFTTTINSSCVALIDCDPGSFVANSADISNQDVDRSCVACTPGTDYSDTTNAPSCTDVDPCATGFSATALSTTQADQTCLANSCKVLFDNGTTDDGVNAISVNNTPVDVYCEMTSQGGGWTRAVIISGNSSFHIEQVGEVGDFAAVPNGDGFDAKMSDAMINSISNAEGSPGFWRLKCGGRDIGVTNTNKVWTSLATNTEAWSLDMADDFASLFDGEYECAASRTGYTFSSGEHTLSTCRDAHLNYGDGVTTETGCYQQTISGIGSDGTWGAGTLWIR